MCWPNLKLVGFFIFIFLKCLFKLFKILNNKRHSCLQGHILPSTVAIKSLLKLNKRGYMAILISL